MLANCLRYLLCALNRLAINRDDPITNSQPSFDCRRVRHYLPNHDRHIAIVGKKVQKAGRLPFLCVRGWFNSQLQPLTVSLDLERYRLTGRQQRVIGDGAPFRILVAIENNDAVTRLKACRFGRSARYDLPNDRRWSGLYTVNHRARERDG